MTGRYEVDVSQPGAPTPNEHTLSLFQPMGAINFDPASGDTVNIDTTALIGTGSLVNLRIRGANNITYTGTTNTPAVNNVNNLVLVTDSGFSIEAQHPLW